jgi:NADH dehydrogenase [ubiquinone] 1 alpha subcomplex assembly factor 6
MSLSLSSSLSYCGQTVRANDPDRFLVSLFAPPETRESLWALFAFNHEIAKTREVVSETATGQLRLLWWREAIEKIYLTGEVPDHEVLKALKVAIQVFELKREDFETLIYAREFDLEDVAPATMDGLLHYADFTSTPLMRMAVTIAGGDPEYEPVHPVAINFALMGLLRAVRFHAGQRRSYLPEDVMKQYGVTQRQLFDFLKPEDGLRDVARDVAAHFVADVKPGNRFLKATQVLAGLYRRQLSGLRYDVFNPRLVLPPAFKELRVWGAV